MEGKMPVVIGIMLKKAGKIYYFDPGALRPEMEEKVVVETGRGTEIGEVVALARELPPEEVITPLKKVTRLATPDDIAKDDANKSKERDAYRVGQDKIRHHALPMKLVEVECLFDGSKMIFYFTAEGRVDFRELVKDLAANFKTRIELRQIGVRDEAKSIGGLGPCGRDLCCRTFLADFEPVSIKMAKEQNLPLNPIKISGVCSRLMCCLKYENDVYVDFRKRAPHMGRDVNTPDGIGRVIGFCAPKDSVMVALEEINRHIQVPLADIGPVDRSAIRKPAPKEEKPAGTKPADRPASAKATADRPPRRRNRGPRRDNRKPDERGPKTAGPTAPASGDKPA
jgi:cell fate regulator YaaT (PSP1 superfamily)